MNLMLVILGIIIGFLVASTAPRIFPIDKVNIEKCISNKGLESVQTKHYFLGGFDIYYECKDGAKFTEEIGKEKINIK